MLRNILPEYINELFKNINFNHINEIRFRVGSPIIVMGDRRYYLSNQGLTLDERQAIKVYSKLIEEILQIISHDSLYAINDQLVRGYISIDGIRIGVAGELVVVNNVVKTIKNISSLNIRIPHFVKNCSLGIFNYLVNSKLYNTLIISPPGAGKTTFLRDFIYQINNNKNRELNVLVVDERSEITTISEYRFEDVDVYKNCSKSYAFDNGIRSMKPDVIVTDEINIDNDLQAIENAITSGVKVVATIHASSILDLKNKKSFQNILDKKLFDRYVVLGFSNGVGTIEGVYNELFRCIYV
jgi:stage III sporulation protein AA